MSSDETVQALLLQMRLMEEYYQELNSREAILLRLYSENKASLSSITSLKDANSASLLVPIGGGAYIPVIYNGGGKLVVDVGANVSLEKTPEETVTYLKDRVKEIEEALRTVSAQKQDVESRLEFYQQQLNSLTAKQAAEKPSQPPPGDA